MWQGRTFYDGECPISGWLRKLTSKCGLPKIKIKMFSTLSNLVSTHPSRSLRYEGCKSKQKEDQKKLRVQFANTHTLTHSHSAFYSYRWRIHISLCVCFKITSQDVGCWKLWWVNGFSCHTGSGGLLPMPSKMDGGYVFTPVSACEQDISKSCGWIRNEFGGQVGCGTRMKWLDFNEDPDTIIFHQRDETEDQAGTRRSKEQRLSHQEEPQ